MKIDKIKGHLDLLLLGVLIENPTHGYGVISVLRERSDGAFELTEGAVYPALHRLEDLGLLRGEWQSASGRKRRLYTVTTAGSKALSRERREWDVLVTAVSTVLTNGTARTAVVGAQ
jgi:PadR family transcriptional regulator PadR